MMIMIDIHTAHTYSISTHIWVSQRRPLCSKAPCIAPDPSPDLVPQFCVPTTFPIPTADPLSLALQVVCNDMMGSVFISAEEIRRESVQLRAIMLTVLARWVGPPDLPPSSLLSPPLPSVSTAIRDVFIFCLYV